jgi:GTP-binding protein
LSVDAQFIKSAAGPGDFPNDGLPEIAMVGRSNVGKSSLVNALCQRAIARTSSTPGRTRLVNLYRVRPERAGALYFVDLPGYGYARGAKPGEFEALTRAYFESRVARAGAGGGRVAALLTVDARHPGLEPDRAAWEWLAACGLPAGIVATKADKLSRGERTRAQQAFERAFTGPVLAVSVTTGEGLKDLWKLIDRLLNSRP